MSSSLKITQEFEAKINGEILKMDLYTFQKITNKANFTKFFKKREHPIRKLEIKSSIKKIPAKEFKFLMKHCLEELWLSSEEKTDLDEISLLAESLATHERIFQKGKPKF